MPPNDRQLVRVALPVPLVETFDYWAPHDGAPPTRGHRVRVPFGRGERFGIVVDLPESTELAPGRLKGILEVPDASAAIGEELLQTLRWAADYYHHPIGTVLAHALPSQVRAGRPLVDAPEHAWQVTPLGRDQDLDRLARSARLQAQAIAALSAGARTASSLREEGVTSAALARLAEKGWIEPVAHEAVPRTAESPRTRLSPMPTLTPDQLSVLASIDNDAASGAGFRAYLLHGITGSGKTEVYLRLIANALAENKQTLMLVPEIGLTPQLVARLRERFGRELAIMHSGLNERERFDAWRRAYQHTAAVVVGTRSAVFAPLPAPGLIIVDEEHDLSYKQQTGLRYSARDLAVVRAQRLRVPVVLGSATPSLESYQNARLGRYRKLDLPRRIGAGGIPEMRIIDLNRHASRQGLSTPLVAAISDHLHAGNQVLLFLNRRGFAPALFCPGCHDVELCHHCDARMTVHAKASALRCHHCGSERTLEWTCPRCGSERIGVGAGTQRVDEELAVLFPRARIARLDRDSTSRKGALTSLLGEVAAGEIDILVGTQMLTKGHDFPRVTLVGILNADQGLFGTDPRSHERFAQTLLQVAGRAGRAERPGIVLVQTHYPDHPLLGCLLSRDYSAFADLALEERRETHWPPFAFLAAWHAEAAQRELPYEFLNHVRAAAKSFTGVEILGPAAHAMERKEGRYRASLLFRSEERAALHRLVSEVLSKVRSSSIARRIRWSLDIDPMEL